LKKLFAALKTRHFLKHFGFALLTFIILFFGIKWFLQSYTRQSAEYTIELPNLIGVTMDQAKEKLDKLELEFDTDTVFSDRGTPGTVLLQNPGPTSVTKQKDKKGRRIYLTLISNQPKLIAVPKLVHKSRRHAEGVLKIIGIKANIKYKPYNDCNDCVIEQLYKGKPLEEGAKIPKGATITLVLGQKSGEKVTVGKLTGLTIEQARTRLSNSSLTMFISCDCKTKKDSAEAVIYRQSPAQGAEVPAGTEISVWLSTDKTLLDDPDDN